MGVIWNYSTVGFADLFWGTFVDFLRLNSDFNFMGGLDLRFYTPQLTICRGSVLRESVIEGIV